MTLCIKKRFSKNLINEFSPGILQVAFILSNEASLLNHIYINHKYILIINIKRQKIIKVSRWIERVSLILKFIITLL